MSAWPEIQFVELVSDETGGNVKTLQSDYLVEGKYPIVDQGQGLIGGYTNDSSRLCKADLPVIVFGDHTKCFKYIDFPFCLGADGTKILRPKQRVDERYLFYALQRIRIPHAGYSRHFKYLKEGKIPLPPLDDQKRIAAILDQADELRRKREYVLDRLGQLGQAIYHEMFSDQQAEWPELPLAEVVKDGTIVTYGIVQAGDEYPGGVPYIRTGDIKNDQIQTDGLRHTAPEIAAKFERSRVCAGEIVMSIRATVGTVAFVPSELDGANLTQGTARISPGPKTTPWYLKEYIRSPAVQGWIERQVKGATFREITLKRLREMAVVLPPMNLQEQFARTMDEIQDQISIFTSALEDARGLFASLQHRAFRGVL
jgi:type I restriction enzyme S subunit